MLYSKIFNAFSFFLFSAILSVNIYSDDIEEFKVKRENNFEFSQEPEINKTVDGIQISFETKGFCDVSIYITNEDGKTIRHLVSGVLGPNAPKPLVKGSKKQNIFWDLKDDKGTYLTNLNACQIHVALGLQAKFEKNILWDPKKKVGTWGKTRIQLIKSCAEGILVYQEGTFDHLKLFDSDGNYKRTIYPFNRQIVTQIKGLPFHTFPHSGTKLPLKKGFNQTTLLLGESTPLQVTRKIVNLDATSIATNKNHIALVGQHIINLPLTNNPLETTLEGPQVSFPYVARGMNADGKTHQVSPNSAAFSPDGKKLYLSGYYYRHTWCLDGKHAVIEVNLEDNTHKIFKGSMNENEHNKGNEGFHIASSVACDQNGNVYVSDFVNNRIQAFSPNGQFIKSIKADYPAKVIIDPHTNDIYVFSWLVHNRTTFTQKNLLDFPPKLTIFSNDKIKGEFNLDLPHYKNKYYEWQNDLINIGPLHEAEIDFSVKPYRLWISENHEDYNKSNIKIFSLEEKSLTLNRNFNDDVKSTSPRTIPAMLNRQRLYVNPANGFLTIGEADGGVGKSFRDVIQINPETNETKVVKLPFDSEDMAFDINGNVYLRTGNIIARYDSQTWREIPWDYGKEKEKVSFESSSDRRASDLISAIEIPGHRAHSFWHLGGMHIAPNGNLAVTACHPTSYQTSKTNKAQKEKFKPLATEYTPPLFPGRYPWGMILIYDKHGKNISKDAFPGVGHMNGITMDNDQNLYAMVSGKRLINGKAYDPDLSDDLTDTLIKVPSNQGKIVSQANDVPLPIQKEAMPTRHPDIDGTQSSAGKAWVENAFWFYGGVGFAGKNASWDGGGCCCWNARFTQDYFYRSFVPELRHYSVGVLDTNGNLIMRIGTYGNADDGLPTANNNGTHFKSVGGDEVSIFHGAYLGVDSNKRLFISDEGNSRIICVKLTYQTEKVLSLKDK